MVNLKKSCLLSKIIIFLSLSTILLTSTLPIQATIGDALRRAGGAVYEKIRGFDKTIVFDKLLEQVGKLGTQIEDIKDCMLYRYECTATKQAAFYGTTITILALTAVVVGFALTATTAKEPDQTLTQTIDTTSSEAQGLQPAAVFERLGNRLATFQQDLLSMKECLVTRQCTQKQKRALYIAAGTIAGLVIITLGLGIGSYLYAKHKKEREGVGLPGEQIGAEKEGLRPSFTFKDTEYKEDASPFQLFFRRVVTITYKGYELLSTTYEQVKEQVQSGLLKTKEAVSHAFLTLLEKGKDFAALLKDVLDVNITELRNAFTVAKKRLNILMSSIEDASTRSIRESFAAQAWDLATYVKKIVDAVDLIKPLGTSSENAIKKVAIIAGQKHRYLEDKLRVRKEEYQKGNISKNLVEEAENDLKIKAFIAPKNLKSIYPTLYEKINALNLRNLGGSAQKIMNGLAALVHAAQWIHAQAGKIGLVISQTAIQENLQSLETRIQGLGKEIQNALDVDRIIEAEPMTTKELVKALVDAAASNGFAFLRENKKKLQQVIAAFKEIDQRVDRIKLGIRDFKKYMHNLQKSAREHFMEAIKNNPAKNIPNAGKILRDSLATAVKSTKDGLAKLINSSSILLTKLNGIMPEAYNVLHNLNEYMKQVSLADKPLINTKFLEGLKRIVTTMKDTANSAKRLDRSMQQVEAAG